MTSTELDPRPGPRPAPEDDGGWVGTFVRRPVLTVVVNLLIIVAGIAALQGIEVRELPDVDRPVVSVSASYEGATPQTMDAQITSLIEGAVSRVPASATSRRVRPTVPAASPSSSPARRSSTPPQWTCATPSEASATACRRT